MRKNHVRIDILDEGEQTTFEVHINGKVVYTDGARNIYNAWEKAMVFIGNESTIKEEIE